MLKLANILTELSAQAAGIKWGIEIELLAPQKYLQATEGATTDLSYVRSRIARNMGRDFTRLLMNWQFVEDTSVSYNRQHQEMQVRNKVKVPKVVKTYEAVQGKMLWPSEIFPADSLAASKAQKFIIKQITKALDTAYDRANEYDKIMDWLKQKDRIGNLETLVERGFKGNVLAQESLGNIIETEAASIVLHFAWEINQRLYEMMRDDYQSFEVVRVRAYLMDQLKKDKASRKRINKTLEPLLQKRFKDARKMLAQHQDKYKVAKEQYEEKVASITSKIKDYRGLEIVSPVLDYNATTVKNVMNLIGFLKKEGFIVNNSTGLHIHVSSKHEHNNFNLVAMSLWTLEHEQEFYLLFGDTRQHSGYADSIKNTFWDDGAGQWLKDVRTTAENLANDKDVDVNETRLQDLFNGLLLRTSPVSYTVAQNDFDLYQQYGEDEMIRSITGVEGRNVGLNLDALTKHETIEFRYGAGSLNQTLVYQYLLLCVEAFYKIFSNRIRYEDVEIEETMPNQKYTVMYGGKHWDIEIDARPTAKKAKKKLDSMMAAWSSDMIEFKELKDEMTDAEDYASDAQMEEFVSDFLRKNLLQEDELDWLEEFTGSGKWNDDVRKQFYYMAILHQNILTTLFIVNAIEMMQDMSNEGTINDAAFKRFMMNLKDRWDYVDNEPYYDEMNRPNQGAFKSASDYQA